MQLKIRKEIVNAHEAFFTAEPYGVDKDRHRYWDCFTVDLRRHSMDTVKELQAQLLTQPKVVGVQNLLRDIKVWIHANEAIGAVGKTRARTMPQAHTLLVEYIRQLPHKHVYTREEEGTEGVVLPYYVEELKYYPPVKRDGYTTPAHITMDCHYIEFGVRHNTTWTFYPNKCLGLTPYEMLVKSEIWPETAELRGDHEYYMELFVAARDAVGKQYLARGLADDSPDGNPSSKGSDWWRSSRTSKFMLDHEGQRARVVVDVFREEDKEKHGGKDSHLNIYYWSQQKNITLNKDDEPEWTGDHDGDEPDEHLTDTQLKDVEVPVHPYVVVFDLKRHLRLRVHVGNMEPYEYNTGLRKSLVLPDNISGLLDVLLLDQGKVPFMDVIKNKSGGTIVLLEGPPGTGKTLTAEILSEAMQRPLFTVQCSQLGVDPEDLESNLLKALGRGRRWNAIMLLDEADVYVYRRGQNLQQNAIVGTFLRVLEYHAGVLFLTTNRGDLVDDAILSRCTARLPYGPPAKEDQARIWAILTEANGVDLDWDVVRQIVDAHPKLSGRDIKNILKLSMMVAHSRGVAITPALVTEVKSFKPTFDAGDANNATSVE